MEPQTPRQSLGNKWNPIPASNQSGRTNAIFKNCFLVQTPQNYSGSKVGVPLNKNLIVPRLIHLVFEAGDDSPPIF